MATLKHPDRTMHLKRSLVLLLTACLFTTGCRANRPHHRSAIRRGPPRVVSAPTHDGMWAGSRSPQSPQPALEPAPVAAAEEPQNASDESSAPVAERPGRDFDPALTPSLTEESGNDADTNAPVISGSGPIRHFLPEPSATALDSAGGNALEWEAPTDENRPLKSATDVLAEIRELGGSVRHAEGEVTGIDLSFTRAADSQLHDLVRFRSLQNLNLTGTDVSDSGLSALADLPLLKSLKLRGTSVSDAALADIAGHSGLQLLDLSRTRISDAAIAHLARLNGLRYLLLNETRVSDAALEDLKSMTNLDGLSLIRTQISVQRKQELQEALPGCLIVFNGEDDVSHLEVPGEFLQPPPAGLARAAMPLRTVSVPARRSVATLRQDSQLTHVVELAQKQPELATHLADIYAQAEDWPSAIHVLQAALDVAPHSQEIRYQLAIALAKSGDVSAASEHFEQCVGPAAAHYNMSLLLHEQMLAACAAHLQQSLALDPNLDAARSWLEELRQKSGESGVRPASAILPVDPALPVIQPRATW